jgi:uncharacterized protein (PEP-CTERM system associated)
MQRGAAALAMAAAAAPLLAPGMASAQKWTVDSGVGANVTWTSNAELGSTAGNGRSDTITDVKPYFAIRSEGTRLRLNGSASLDAVTSAHDTQPSRILVDADLAARLEAIQRFFFIEGDLRASQTNENPFGPRPVDTTTLGTTTTTGARLTPTIESDIDPLTRYRLRSENTWARSSGSTAAITGDGYFGRHSASIEHDPRPFGWQLTAQREETRYVDAAQPTFSSDIVRARARYAVSPELVAGLRAGRERTSLDVGNESSNVYGAEADWHPSPATALSAFGEHRWFGSSYHVTFDQNQPKIAWGLALSRDLDTSPQSLLEQPANQLAALLDAMFQSRIPDPVDRARAVRDFINQQGVPASSALGPIDLFSQRVSVATRRSAKIAFIGVRSTLTLSAYYARTEDAPGTSALPTAAPLANNDQNGATATLAHRLTPTTSLSLVLSWNRIRALQAPDRSYDREARLQANLALAPRTNAMVALRRRTFESNVVPPGDENAVIAGIDHRF